ncbi:MAG TPA: class I SAM-dependent methyltransferase [Anaeromyxobacter sp.]|nr:class I SAM-dependent methyltransferase [Anaeromyxobacter sp.]
MDDFGAKARSWDLDPSKAERARRVADLIAARVPMLAGARVLEVGAGTGLLGLALRDRVKHVTLADGSAEMLAVAGEKVAAIGPCNVDLLPIDLERDRPRGRYELVCALLVLHHVEDVDALLDKLHDALEPGGYLCISDLEAEDGGFHGPGFTGHHGFDRGALRASLERAGFSEIEFQHAFEIEKPVKGVTRSFPAFLAFARRPATSPAGSSP